MAIGNQESTFIKSNIKFGRIISSVTSYNLISAMGVALPFFPTAPTLLSVAAADATDTASGTGARQVHLEGFGSGWIEQSEDIWLDATSPVDTALEYLRVERMFVQRVGSNDTNASAIWCGTGAFTVGVPASKVSHIFSGDGQTQECKFTVPVSVQAHVHLMWFTSGKAVGLDVVTNFRIRTRRLDDTDRPWRYKYDGDAFDGQIGGDTSLDAYVFVGPMDVVVEAIGTAAGARQTALLGFEFHKTFQGVE